MTTETLENEFGEVLSTIADGLGIAAERIFGTFVSAQMMLGIIGIVSVVLTILGASFVGWYSMRICIKWWTDEHGNWKDCDDKAIAVWLTIIATVIALFSISIITEAIGDSVMMLLCPEYTSMKEIIELMMP